MKKMKYRPKILSMILKIHCRISIENFIGIVILIASKKSLQTDQKFRWQLCMTAAETSQKKVTLLLTKQANPFHSMQLLMDLNQMQGKKAKCFPLQHKHGLHLWREIQEHHTHKFSKLFSSPFLMVVKWKTELLEV